MSIDKQLAKLRQGAPATITDGVMLGTGLIDGYATFDSPVGDVVVAFNPNGVSALDLVDDDAVDRFTQRFNRPLTPAEPPRGWTAKIRRAIELGRPGDLAIDYRSVTEFQQQVLGVATRIPRGQVRPYQWLAQQVGRSNATLAVGSTMARNPVPLIIPCHRVVRSDGRIGNYSLGGTDNKERIIRGEGTEPEWLNALAQRHTRYFGSATTGVYCHPTCANAKRITDKHRVELRSSAQANSAGYRPCKVCQPA